MSRYYHVVIVFTLLIIVGCATAHKDIKVSAEVDSKANLKGYKTYAWLGSSQIVWDEKGQWEPPQLDLDAEMKFLIDRELRKRGMTEVADNPDMIVGFIAGVDMDALKITENPESKNLSLKNVPKGDLVVVLVDASSGFSICVCKAEAELQKQAGTLEVKKRLDYAVSKMFKLLPR